MRKIPIGKPHLDQEDFHWIEIIDDILLCFSNVTNRGLIGSNFLQSQTSQQDSISQSDSGIEQSNSPSFLLRQRAMIKTRSVTNPSMIHSNSSNGLTNSPSEYRDNSPATSMKQSRTTLDGMLDLSNDDLLVDQQEDDLNPSVTDLHSMSSPEKRRKQHISTKIFKPFQNMRFRKKNSTS